MASFTPENMSGKYKLNKQLSTNMEELMQIQKVGWVVRKAVTSAPVALSLTHDNTTFNALAEVAGIPGTANNRRLDGTSVEEKDPILGLIKKCAVVAVLGDVTEAYLKEAWKGLDPATKLVLTSYESVKEGWKTLEITTVQEIDGQVRLVLYCFGTNDKGEVVCGRVIFLDGLQTQTVEPAPSANGTKRNVVLLNSPATLQLLAHTSISLYQPVSETLLSAMQLQKTFATLVVFIGAIASVSASPAMEENARRDMKSSLEKKENCYCFNSDDTSVHCGRSADFGVSGYCPSGQNRVCCDDCSHHGC
ncbi:hypothetical protein BDZ89DRAFT_1160847 [Hymenopellis radicata]|nr:hypothetical protein BDZ89DRAFT_1160847 [Hymenopellis radicata]